MPLAVEAPNSGEMGATTSPGAHNLPPIIMLYQNGGFYTLCYTFDISQSLFEGFNQTFEFLLKHYHLGSVYNVYKGNTELSSQ